MLSITDFSAKLSVSKFLRFCAENFYHPPHQNFLDPPLVSNYQYEQELNMHWLLSPLQTFFTELALKFSYVIYFSYANETQRFDPISIYLDESLFFFSTHKRYFCTQTKRHKSTNQRWLFEQSAIFSAFMNQSALFFFVFFSFYLFLAMVSEES